MNELSVKIVELARRLPAWVRLAIGVPVAGLLACVAYRLARQASVDASNAVIVALVLAAWVLAYLVMRLMRERRRR